MLHLLLFTVFPVISLVCHVFSYLASTFVRFFNTFLTVFVRFSNAFSPTFVRFSNTFLPAFVRFSRKVKKMYRNSVLYCSFGTQVSDP